MSQPPLLQIHDVSRTDTSTGKHLLKSASLLIHAGDRIGLVGNSGSGKSTFLRAMAMLDRCTGEWIFKGNTITKDDIPAYRRTVIYLSQRPFFTTGTVEENLRLPFLFKSAEAGARDSFQRDLAASTMQTLGLSPQILNQPAESLSGGEQQMVSLIRALLLDPQILLLDEPTAALDSDAKLRFEERILKWHRESNAGNEDGRAFLWTSHDPNQVDRLTDQTLTMQQGELILPTGPNSENQSANKSNQQANGVG